MCTCILCVCGSYIQVCACGTVCACNINFHMLTLCRLFDPVDPVDRTSLSTAVDLSTWWLTVVVTVDTRCSCRLWVEGSRHTDHGVKLPPAVDTVGQATVHGALLVAPKAMPILKRDGTFTSMHCVKMWRIWPHTSTHGTAARSRATRNFMTQRCIS